MFRKPRLTLWLAMLLAAFLVGCQSSSPPTETTGTEAPSGKSAKAAKGTKARAEAREELVTAPAGTTLTIRLAEGIDTGKTPEGARFDGSLAEPLVVRGVEVAGVGNNVAGNVTHVISSGRLNRPAELSLVLTALVTTGGDTIEISTSPWSVKGESHKKRNLEMIGGGGGAGALIGALAGGKKGALIGGAVGAGAGTGAAAYTGKKEIVLSPETKLTFKLSAPATLRIRR